MPKVKQSTELLQHAINPPPATLDYLEFEFQGVTFRTFGILHGITGGLNQDYRNFVTNSIRSTEGVKLAEKGMKHLYSNCGITNELEDWLVLRRIDCVIMGFQLLADPRCLWMITVDALREKFRKNDAFITNNRKNINHLGESRYFHYLDEHERRELVGFLPSHEAIKQDLHSMSAWYKSILPKRRHVTIKHPQWKRILLLERIMHIPCRSIHMLYFALAYAKKHNHNLVNIFVGETHNTDMLYLSKNVESFKKSLDFKQQNIMQNIINTAMHYGGSARGFDSLALFWNKLNYLTFLLLGATIPFSLYFALYRIISI